MLAAGRVRSKTKKSKEKSTEKSAPPPITHHEIHSHSATATNSRQHARKHVTRVSPYCPASIDPGSVEIGLEQLSQSAKTANVTYRLTDTQTDKLNNGTLYTPRYEKAFCLKAKNGLILKRLFSL